MPRKSPSKDKNGGKLGQYTTDVADTIAKAKEEQKKESAELCRRVLDDMKKNHEIGIKLAKREGIEIGRRYHKAAFYFTLFFGGFLGFCLGLMV